MKPKFGSSSPSSDIFFTKKVNNGGPNGNTSVTSASINMFTSDYFGQPLKPPFTVNVKGLHNLESQPEEDSANDNKPDLSKTLKGFLIIGKVIGLLPFSGVFSRNAEMSFK